MLIFKMKCWFEKWNFIVNRATNTYTSYSWSFLTLRVIWSGSIIYSLATVSGFWDVETLGESKTQW